MFMCKFLCEQNSGAISEKQCSSGTTMLCRDKAPSGGTWAVGCVCWAKMGNLSAGPASAT